MEQRFKPGDRVRIKADYYPPSLNADLVHVIKVQSHGDRYAIYCVSPVIWQDVAELTTDAATCLFCMAHENNVPAFEDDLNELQRRITAAVGLPDGMPFGKKP